MHEPMYREGFRRPGLDSNLPGMLELPKLPVSVPIEIAKWGDEHCLKK